MANLDFTTRSLPLKLDSNTGGLNSTGSPLSLQDNESSDCQNIDFDKFGAFKQRGGYTQLNSVAFNSGATWTGLHWFELNSGTNYIMGTCGNKIGKMDGLDGTWDDITGGLTVTAGNNNHWYFQTFNNTVGATNGVDAPFKWTGSGNASAMTLPTNVTKPAFIKSFFNHTFIAKVLVSGANKFSRIYWSNQDTLDTWTDTDFRDLNLDDGQEVTGMEVLGETLVVFKERSIYIGLFTGDTDFKFVFTPTRSVVGCTAPGSIRKAENGLFFRFQDDYYFFDGQNSFKASDRVRNTIAGFNKNRFANTQAIFYETKNRYITSETTSGNTTHNRNLTFDTHNNAWSYYKGLNANCFVQVYTSGQERIYFGDYAGFVYQIDTGNNDYPSGTETAIDAYYYTKWMSVDDLITQKAFPQVNVYYRISESTLTFAYSYDFDESDTYSLSFSMSGGASVYGTAAYGTGTYATTGGKLKKVHLTGRGNVVRMKFQNDTVDETFTIDGFGIYPHLETNV